MEEYDKYGNVNDSNFINDEDATVKLFPDNFDMLTTQPTISHSDYVASK